MHRAKLNPLIKLNVVINDKFKIKALYDCASNVTLLNKRIAKLLRLRLMKQKSILKTINGLDFTEARAIIKLRIGKLTDSISTYIVKNDNFSYDMLLGIDAIQKFKLIQTENLKILQRVNKDKVISLQENEQVDENLHKSLLDPMKIPPLKQHPSDEYIEVNFNEYLHTEKFEANLEYIETEEKRQSILHLLDKYNHVFAKDKFDIGKVKSKEAEIKLIRDEYVTSRPYKCSILDGEEIKMQIKKLLEADIVEESESPFASPVTLAYKKYD
jgi:hypothetical protein